MVVLNVKSFMSEWDYIYYSFRLSQGFAMPRLASRGVINACRVLVTTNLTQTRCRSCLFRVVFGRWRVKKLSIMRTDGTSRNFVRIVLKKNSDMLARGFFFFFRGVPCGGSLMPHLCSLIMSHYKARPSFLMFIIGPDTKNSPPDPIITVT